MIERKEFGSLIGEFGLPHAFWEFDNEEEVPPLPYIVYYDLEPSIFHADNQAYYLASRFAVEFYSEKKEDGKIAELEAFFNAHKWAFTHEPSYIPEEELFMEYFEVQT